MRSSFLLWLASFVVISSSFVIFYSSGSLFKSPDASQSAMPSNLQPLVSTPSPYNDRQWFDSRFNSLMD
ncbi:MAG: hypothetical protein AAB909_02980, partial [Patescibacteria group bacterium]